MALRRDAPLKLKAADLTHAMPSDGCRDLINRRRLSESKMQLWMTDAGKNHPFIYTSVMTDVPLVILNLFNGYLN